MLIFNWSSHIISILYFHKQVSVQFSLQREPIVKPLLIQVWHFLNLFITFFFNSTLWKRVSEDSTKHMKKLCTCEVNFINLCLKRWPPKTNVIPVFWQSQTPFSSSMQFSTDVSLRSFLCDDSVCFKLQRLQCLPAICTKNMWSELVLCNG